MNPAKIANEIIKKSNSDAFLTNFSKTLGTPHDEESEEEFVARAKSLYMRLIDDLF